jgi:DNA-3-methyladenine glycosylase
MILPRKFYQRDTPIVAKELLGKKIIRIDKNTIYSGIITETEAYRASDDAASHATNKITKRNHAMFETVGKSYVYFTYGMYHCLNVVARDKKFSAGAVLIRGVHPIEGIKKMEKNRIIKKFSNLTNGPGKLTQALNITIKDYGIDMTRKSNLYIISGINPDKINVSKRVGISKAMNKKWNFSINPKDYF